MAPTQNIAQAIGPQTSQVQVCNGTYEKIYFHKGPFRGLILEPKECHPIRLEWGYHPIGWIQRAEDMRGRVYKGFRVKGEVFISHSSTYIKTLPPFTKRYSLSNKANFKSN